MHAYTVGMEEVGRVFVSADTSKTAATCVRGQSAVDRARRPDNPTRPTPPGAPTKPAHPSAGELLTPRQLAVLVEAAAGQCLLFHANRPASLPRPRLSHTAAG